MVQTMRVLLLCLFSFGFLEFSAADSATDYAESTRKLLVAYNQLENKLERHELRERALGEIIRNSLQSLQRGQRILRQLQYGRVSQIENQLKAQEERFCSRLENLHLLKPSNVAAAEVDNNAPQKVEATATATPNQELCRQTRPQEGLTSADKEFIQELVNTNEQSIVQTTQDDTVSRFREVDQRFYAGIDAISKRFNTQEDLMQQFYAALNASSIKANAKLECLDRCNSVSQPLTQAVDAAASNNNMQVIAKQHDELLDLLKTRFDTVDKNMANMQLEMATHLNTTIQNEATYLWRQIAITNGELNQSKDLLRLMRDRNDIYVNSVLQSMSSMGNRVEAMKERIMDVNDSQNDLLQKLPLLSHEFADMQQAFIGLLERLNETLKLVQEKKKLSTL